MTRRQITVLLADDHALVRRGFRRLLEDDPRSRSSAKRATATKPSAWRASSAAGRRDGRRHAGHQRARRDHARILDARADARS